MSDQYTYQSFMDFTGGLWTVGDVYLMPPTALRQMDDCYALPGGGLRATVKFAAGTTTGLFDQTGQCVGLWDVDGGSGGSTGARGNKGGIFAQLVFPNGAGAGLPAVRCYKLADRKTTSLSSGTWSTVLALGSTAACNYAGPPGIANYHQTSDIYGTFFSVGWNTANVGGPEGVVSWDGDVSAFAIPTVFSANLLTHQARIVYSGVNLAGDSHHTVLAFTDPGSTATPAGANLIYPGEESSEQISWLISRPPSDLIVAKRGKGIFLIQGDVSSTPFIRQMTFSNANFNGCKPSITPYGLVYNSEQEGTFSWTGGSQIEHLSAPLQGSPMFINNQDIQTQVQDCGGQVGFANDWLFAGNGYIFDFQTKSWHNNTSLTNHNWISISPYCGSGPSFTTTNVLALGGMRGGSNLGGGWLLAGKANTAAPFFSYAPLNPSSWTRSNTWTIRLAPIPIPERTPHVREIELAVSNNGSSTFTVVVNGSTFTASNISTSQQVVKIPISVPGSTTLGHMDIKITGAAVSSTVEAPILRYVRLGYLMGAMKAKTTS